jgi:hypothetical protein
MPPGFPVDHTSVNGLEMNLQSGSGRCGTATPSSPTAHDGRAWREAPWPVGDSDEEAKMSVEAALA